jgi:hypothetical protein
MWTVNLWLMLIMLMGVTDISIGMIFYPGWVMGTVWVWILYIYRLRVWIFTGSGCHLYWASLERMTQHSHCKWKVRSSRLLLGIFFSILIFFNQYLRNELGQIFSPGAGACPTANVVPLRRESRQPVRRDSIGPFAVVWLTAQLTCTMCARVAPEQ